MGVLRPRNDKAEIALGALRPGNEKAEIAWGDLRPRNHQAGAVMGAICLASWPERCKGSKRSCRAGKQSLPAMVGQTLAFVLLRNNNTVSSGWKAGLASQGELQLSYKMPECRQWTPSQ